MDSIITSFISIPIVVQIPVIICDGVYKCSLIYMAVLWNTLCKIMEVLTTCCLLCVWSSVWQCYCNVFVPFLKILLFRCFLHLQLVVAQTVSPCICIQMLFVNFLCPFAAFVRWVNGVNIEWVSWKQWARFLLFQALLSVPSVQLAIDLWYIWNVFLNKCMFIFMNELRLSSILYLLIKRDF